MVKNYLTDLDLNYLISFSRSVIGKYIAENSLPIYRSYRNGDCALKFECKAGCTGNFVVIHFSRNNCFATFDDFDVEKPTVKECFKTEYLQFISSLLGETQSLPLG